MQTNNPLAIFILRLCMGILFLAPGIYKVFMPQDFMGFLANFPAFLAGVLPVLFWIVTAFEIVAGIFFIVGYKVRYVALPAAGVLAVALVTVVIPDAAVSSIGLINILFHILGVGLCVAFVFFEHGKWSLEDHLAKK